MSSKRVYYNNDVVTVVVVVGEIAETKRLLFNHGRHPFTILLDVTQITLYSYRVEVSEPFCEFRGLTFGSSVS